MVQEVTHASFHEVGLISFREIGDSQQIYFLEASVGYVLIKQLIESLRLNLLPQIVRQTDNSFISLLRTHHVQQIVKYIADLLHLHLVLRSVALTLAVILGSVHIILLGHVVLHGKHFVHEVFHIVAHLL